MTNSGRTYFLSHQEREIRATARHELAWLCVYPDDEHSLRQALSVVADEYQRWLDCEGEAFEHSDLFFSLSATHEGKTGGRVTCGLMALAQMGLRSIGFLPSVNLAAEVVTEFGATAGKIPLRFTSKGGKERKINISIPADVADATKHWSKYKAVGHILAASIIGEEYFFFDMGFDRYPEAEACFVNILMASQNSFFSLPNAENWNLWSVACHPPYDPADFPVLTGQETMKQLFKPWLESGKAGHARQGRRANPDWKPEDIGKLKSPGGS